MGSGRKSNGYRPVNKADGPKKRGKKAMKKSRRKDSKKEIQKPDKFDTWDKGVGFGMGLDD